MKWLTDILGGGAGDLVKSVGGVIDNLHTSKEEKMAAELKIKEIVHAGNMKVEERLQTELHAKSNIMMAEMQQSDNYTKRARPTVVYYGLVAITLDFIARVSILMLGILPLEDIPKTFLPNEFWLAWGGVVSVWVMGRSYEKRGVKNKITDFITGSKGIKGLFG
jgi:hypothetical protein